MSARSRFLSCLPGRPHHVTISAEHMCVMSRERCKYVGKLYGISGAELHRRVHGDNLDDRTFRVVHLVPLYLSTEELKGDIDVLRRIAEERHLDWQAVTNVKNYLALGAPRVVVNGTSCVPAPALGGALARVLATRTTSCFGLHLVATVQGEGVERQSASVTLTSVEARAHLQRLPLPALHRVIEDLYKARAAWERDLLAPAAAAAAQQQAQESRDAVYALLYHVCLWQRRYPLELLSAVLQFYDAHKDAFAAPHTASGNTPRKLEALLEEVHSLRYPDMSDVPGLVRCDVLMTYPRMPLEEQQRLMRSVASAVAQRAAREHSPSTDPRRAGGECLADDNLLLHSRTPPDPRMLLRAVVAVGDAASVPHRFCGAVPAETYHAMREAFERHKHDGVRRLAALAYGSTASPPASVEPPLQHSAAAPS